MALVLVIDDEPMMREVLREMLEMAGHKVKEAADGVEGLAHFRHYQPDVTVTDILMPHSGGLHLISEIRKTNPSAKILAISGGGRDGKLNFLNTAKTFSGVITLKKPCPRSELIAAVKSLLEGGNKENAPGPDADTCGNLKHAPQALIPSRRASF